MINALRQMLTCHWSARRIQRYLDADTGAPLTRGDVARLEEHLSTCAKCRHVAEQHRALHRALSVWSSRNAVDPGSIERVRSFLDTLAPEETQ